MKVAGVPSSVYRRSWDLGFGRLRFLLPLACFGAVGLALADTQTGRLGAELTPVGAERAGNKDLTIPAWTGGDTQPSGQPRPDAYGSERPKLSINSTNVDAHADRLTPGQVQLVKSLAGYRMDIYPTHRSCGVSPIVAARTSENLGFAKVSEDGYRLSQAKAAAIPFPTPKTGVEAMWNVKLRPMGEGFTWRFYTIIPPATGNGIGEPVVSDEYVMYPMGNPKNEDMVGAKGVEVYFLSPYVAPAQFAGDVTLVHSFMGRPADAWLYFASQRRVRRAPTYEYDAPIINWENLMTIDSYNMFGGQLNRYDFKLIGKKEIYVPYNWTKINQPSSNPASVVSPKFINRDVARYELHRVWVVEATVKAGARHTFPKRTLFIDEDTWTVVVSDLYDSQGKVQRVMETGPLPVPELQACAAIAFASYDLPSGRVAVDRLAAGSKGIDWLAAREGRVKASMFEPDDLRRFTTR